MNDRCRQTHQPIATDGTIQSVVNGAETTAEVWRKAFEMLALFQGLQADVLEFDPHRLAGV